MRWAVLNHSKTTSSIRKARTENYFRLTAAIYEVDRGQLTKKVVFVIYPTIAHQVFDGITLYYRLGEFNSFSLPSILTRCRIQSSEVGPVISDGLPAWQLIAEGVFLERLLVCGTSFFD